MLKATDKTIVAYLTKKFIVDNLFECFDDPGPFGFWILSKNRRNNRAYRINAWLIRAVENYDKESSGYEVSAVEHLRLLLNEVQIDMQLKSDQIKIGDNVAIELYSDLFRFFIYDEYDDVYICRNCGCSNLRLNNECSRLIIFCDKCPNEYPLI